MTCFWGLNPDFDLKGRKLAILDPVLGPERLVLVVLDPFGSIWQNRGLKVDFDPFEADFDPVRPVFGPRFGLKGGFEKLENLKSRTDFENENESTQKAEYMKGKMEIYFQKY